MVLTFLLKKDILSTSESNKTFKRFHSKSDMFRLKTYKERSLENVGGGKVGNFGSGIQGLKTGSVIC